MFGFDERIFGREASQETISLVKNMENTSAKNTLAKWNAAFATFNLAPVAA